MGLLSLGAILEICGRYSTHGGGNERRQGVSTINKEAEEKK